MSLPPPPPAARRRRRRRRRRRSARQSLADAAAAAGFGYCCKAVGVKRIMMTRSKQNVSASLIAAFENLISSSAVSTLCTHD